MSKPVQHTWQSGLPFMALGFVLSFSQCRLALAEDWFQWRGPNRDGVAKESNLQDKWSTQGPSVLYKTKGLGSSMSSIATMKDRLVTMGNLAGQTHLVCLNRQDGSLAWKTPFTPAKGSPNCTPTIDPESGLIYALSFDGVLACCRANDGSLAWKKNFGTDFGGKMESGWGYSESPLIDGDKLLCTPGGKEKMVVALNKKTGDLLWSGVSPVGNLRGNDGAGYSSIVISNAQNRKQYVQLVGHGIVSYDAGSGELLWNYDRVANRTANIPTPLVKDNFVFCSSGYDDGGSALLEIIREGEKLSAKEVYYKSAKELQNHHGGMIMMGDHVFMGQGHNNGFPACLEWKTGKNLWEKSRGAGGGSAAIVSADNKLFFRYQDGVMALIDTDTRKYRPLGHFKLAIKNGESWPHPVIVDGKLYIRDQDELIVYDISKS